MTKPYIRTTVTTTTTLKTTTTSSTTTTLISATVNSNANNNSDNNNNDKTIGCRAPFEVAKMPAPVFFFSLFLSISIFHDFYFSRQKMFILLPTSSVTRLGDYRIFWQKFLLARQQKCLTTLRAVMKSIGFLIKLVMLHFGQLLEKIGQLFISASGHTTCFVIIQFPFFANNCKSIR